MTIGSTELRSIGVACSATVISRKASGTLTRHDSRTKGLAHNHEVLEEVLQHELSKAKRVVAKPAKPSSTPRGSFYGRPAGLKL